MSRSPPKINAESNISRALTLNANLSLMILASSFNVSHQKRWNGNALCLIHLSNFVYTALVDPSILRFRFLPLTIGSWRSALYFLKETTPIASKFRYMIFPSWLRIRRACHVPRNRFSSRAKVASRTELPAPSHASSFATSFSTSCLVSFLNPISTEARWLSQSW